MNRALRCNFQHFFVSFFQLKRLSRHLDLRYRLFVGRSWILTMNSLFKTVSDTIQSFPWHVLCNQLVHQSALRSVNLLFFCRGFPWPLYTTTIKNRLIINYYPSRSREDHVSLFKIVGLHNVRVDEPDDLFSRGKKYIWSIFHGFTNECVQNHATFLLSLYF